MLPDLVLAHPASQAIISYVGMCWSSWNWLVLNPESCLIFLHFPSSFTPFHVSSFPPEPSSHYLNNYTLLFLFLSRTPRADGLSHSSEAIFSAELSQGHAAALHQTRGPRQLTSRAAGYAGSSWQRGAHFPGSQRSPATPRAEIPLCHFSTQPEA